ncbi:Nitrogen permease regulator 2 [Geranomyces michiganensis]|nr:Nitrogen permease regulator 2 [Geranomyces michiganensis]
MSTASISSPQTRENSLRQKQLELFLLGPANAQLDRAIDSHFNDLVQLARKKFGTSLEKQEVVIWVEEQLNRLKVFEEIDFASEAEKIWQDADMQEALQGSALAADYKFCVPYPPSVLTLFSESGTSVPTKNGGPSPSKKRARDDDLESTKSKRLASVDFSDPSEPEPFTALSVEPSKLKNGAKKTKKMKASMQRDAAPASSSDGKRTSSQVKVEGLESTLPHYAIGSTVAARITKKEGAVIYVLKVKGYNPASATYDCVDPEPQHKQKNSWLISKDCIVDFKRLATGATYKANDKVYALSRTDGGLTTEFYPGVIDKATSQVTSDHAPRRTTAEMDGFQGFPPVLAIFYAEFHPTQGPKVMFQVPEHFVASSSSSAAPASTPAFLLPASQPGQSVPQSGYATAPPLAHGSGASSTLALLMHQQASSPTLAATPGPVTPNFGLLSTSRSAVSPNLSSSLISPPPQSLHNQQNVRASATTGSAAAAAPPRPASLDFDSISEYIIPKPALSNRLVTISTPQYKILSHPVTITSQKYERNALLFNLCFVFEKNAQTTVYEQVVRKLARVLRSLEVQTAFLSNQSGSSSASAGAKSATAAPSAAGVLSTSSSSSQHHQNNDQQQTAVKQPQSSPSHQQSRGDPTLGDILEQILEDLNSYAECQIPINDSSTINLKLFPKYPDPPPVHDHEVPVLVVRLARIMDKHWDMTLRRIIPLIDGVRSVRRLAEAADVDPQLTRIALQHLLYYGCIRLVDIFSFSNVYAIRASITGLLHAKRLQRDLSAFVTRVPIKVDGSNSKDGGVAAAHRNGGGDGDGDGDEVTGTFPAVNERRNGAPATAPTPFALLFSLYCALKPGLTVAEWIEENNVWDLNVDVRRFILFGVLHGFVYRVHKYPIWVARPPPSDAASESHPPQQTPTPPPLPPPLPLQHPGATSQPPTAGAAVAPAPQPLAPRTIRRFLDGTRHYDALCTLFGCSPRDLDEILAGDAPGCVRFVWR